MGPTPTSLSPERKQSAELTSHGQSRLVYEIGERNEETANRSSAEDLRRTKLFIHWLYIPLSKPMNHIDFIIVLS